MIGMCVEESDSPPRPVHALHCERELPAGTVIEIFAEATLAEAPLAKCQDESVLAVLEALVGTSAEMQSKLLRALEGLSANASVAPTLPVMLKTFYDRDILEEGVILSWNAGCTNEAVVERVRPFVEWLAAAESDDDEGD